MPGATIHLAKRLEAWPLNELGIKNVEQQLAAPDPLGNIDLLLYQRRRHDLQVLQAVLMGTAQLVLMKSLTAAYFFPEPKRIDRQANDDDCAQGQQNKCRCRRHEGLHRLNFRRLYLINPDTSPSALEHPQPCIMVQQQHDKHPENAADREPKR